MTETAKAAASPWHRSSRGTALARPGGLSVPRDASSSRALSLLFDQSDTVRRPLFSRWLSERLAGRHGPWLGALTTLRRSESGISRTDAVPKRGSYRFDIRGGEATASSVGRAALHFKLPPGRQNHLSPPSRSRYDRAPGTIVDQDPRSKRQYVRGIDPDPQRALKWLPLVLVLLGLGFGVGALLGSAGTGVAIGVGLTGVFVAWREVLSERRQQELDHRGSHEAKQLLDHMPGDPSKLTPLSGLGAVVRIAGCCSLNSGSSRRATQHSDAKRLATDDS